jgi:hypothetical protein
MPPRKPMTRHFPREPKLKEANIGEGSSPGAARKLEFSPKVESVIKTSTKKAFSQPPTFCDTKETTGLNMILPQWGDLFNRIN